MRQLKAESKEAYADYLPLQGSIFGCSAAANAMNSAATEERSHMRVIVPRIHFTPLSGPEALILFYSLCSLQRVTKEKGILGTGQKDLRNLLSCPTLDLLPFLHGRRIPRLLVPVARWSQ